MIPNFPEKNRLLPVSTPVGVISLIGNYGELHRLCHELVLFYHTEHQMVRSASGWNIKFDQQLQQKPPCCRGLIYENKRGADLPSLHRSIGMTCLRFFLLFAFYIFFSPCTHLIQHRLQRPPKFIQFINHFGGNLVKDNTVNHTIFFQFTQLLGQHFLRNIGHGFFQFTRPHRSMGQMAQDDCFPFSADHFQCGFNRNVIEFVFLFHCVSPFCFQNQMV